MWSTVKMVHEKTDEKFPVGNFGSRNPLARLMRPSISLSLKLSSNGEVNSNRHVGQLEKMKKR